MRSLPSRSQPAPTTVTTQRGPVMVVPLPGVDATQSGLTRPSSRGRGTPRRLFLVGGALVGGVLAAAVLAGAMSDAVTSRAVAQEATAANALVAARLAAVGKEIEFAATPAFQGFAARRYGYGRASERLFVLAAGAPAPPSIEPLGSAKLATPPTDALDAVLDLLFER